jgi:dTDP-glucose 4,6-dehydratase
MKQVLVTGAAGFIGSTLTELLVEEGLKVRALVRYNSKNDWGWLEDSPLKKDIEVTAGDVRDFDAVSRAMEGCDTVFHLAALIGIPYSYVSPLAYVRTNVEGTYNVLEAARRLGLDNVLVTSTSEVYGTAQFVPITEEHPNVAQSPYSATKISADQLALSYFRSFDLPVKVVRPFNTYGPRQSARAIIPTITGQLLAGRTTIKLGNLHPTRDLTYVKDTASGFLAIARSEQSLGEVTNIGMNHEISIGDLAELIASVVGVKAEITGDEERIRPSKSEVERLVCDNSKILAATNWKPQYDLKRGLEETVEFMKDHLHLYKTDLYVV